MNEFQKISGRDEFGKALVELGAAYPELVVLDADVATSTRTSEFGKIHPDRFFNVGVAEANMVDVAAGLSTCGLRPVASTFALFLALKGAEQIRNTVCYNKLPVILAGGYAGLSDSFDGASHQSITDLAVMRAMPHLTVVVPGDPTEIKPALEQALRRSGPTYLRLGRNPTPVLFAQATPSPEGKIRKLRDGHDLTIAVTGVPTYMAIAAAKALEEAGIDADLLEIITLKPLDVETLSLSARKTRRVLTIEEHTIHGGLGGAVAEALCQIAPARVERMGIPDCFTESGEYESLLAKYGLSEAAIVERATRLVRG